MGVFDSYLGLGLTSTGTAPLGGGLMRSLPAISTSQDQPLDMMSRSKKPPAADLPEFAPPEIPQLASASGDDAPMSSPPKKVARPKPVAAPALSDDGGDASGPSPSSPPPAPSGPKTVSAPTGGMPSVNQAIPGGMPPTKVEPKPAPKAEPRVEAPEPSKKDVGIGL